METKIEPAPVAPAIERALVEGDLSGLTAEQRAVYYSRVCESLGLNPLTRPFQYLRLNGKLTLYATRDAADQLRRVRGITITGLEVQRIDDLYVVVASGRDSSGREDRATGAVAIAGLRGEALANAMMRAETKAKRRLTLSLAGLGWSDETEIASIPDAEPVPTPSLAERVAQRVEAISAPVVAEIAAKPEEPAEQPGPEPEAAAPEPLSYAGLYERLGRATARGATRELVYEVCDSLGLPRRISALTDEERGRVWAALDARLAPAAEEE